MRKKWIMLGCFLTGYNYDILMSCSQLAIKRLMKYTSAILVVCVLWCLIGFAFAFRYLEAPWYLAVLFAAVMILLVVQVERQILLTFKKGKFIYGFRAMIALTMALLGTIIVDQIIFAKDIEKQKLLNMDVEFKQVMQRREKTLNMRIQRLDSTIVAKDKERSAISDDIQKNPTISIWEPVTLADSTGATSISYARRQILNTKSSLIPDIDRTITSLREEKKVFEDKHFKLESMVDEELKSNIGFLDELKVMFAMLLASGVCLGAWILWFLFFLSLELFLLISKGSDGDTDYDFLMRQLMELHQRKIELLREKMV
jgi:hypothetical protein